MEPETIIKQALGGKYKILHVIGKGGMATVYKAIQNNLNRPVALKVIHQNMVHDEEFIKRFKREAQVCSSVNHANIVTVYDVGSVGTVHFMSMEYLEGMTLRELIKARGPLSAEDTVRYISPVADVLGLMHNKGIVHRDIKSANIFITNDERVVLMDFGVVLSEGREPLSLSGSIIGTPEYMSPEQAEGKLKVDGRSDIFSLGVVIFECLTRQIPFLSDNYITTLYNVLNEQPPSITSINPKVPKWLSSIVASCLQKDRNLRIHDGFNLAKALREKEKLKIIVNTEGNEKLTRKIFSKEITTPEHPEIAGRKVQSSPGKDKFLKSSILMISALILILVWIKFSTGNINSGSNNENYNMTNWDSIYKESKKSVDNSTVPVPMVSDPIGATENGKKIKPSSGTDNNISENVSKKLDEGDKLLEEGRYEEAMKSYYDVLKLDPNSNIVKERISETTKKWKGEVILKGEMYLLNKNYDSAIFIFNSLRKYEKRDKTVNSALSRATALKNEYENHLKLNLSMEANEEKLQLYGIHMIMMESKSLGNFYLSESEVTQKLWIKIMGSNPSFATGDDLPIERISWTEVQTFLARLNQETNLNFRLPTVNEWEFSASGGHPLLIYSGSNRLSEVGWYEANSESRTHPVRKLIPNDFGIYDMSGNVWEWCSDHSLKGGSWLSISSQCKISNFGNQNDLGDYTIGFRICRSAD